MRLEYPSFLLTTQEYEYSEDAVLNNASNVMQLEAPDLQLA